MQADQTKSGAILLRLVLLSAIIITKLLKQVYKNDKYKN